MYIKIYFTDKPVFLCNQVDGPVEAYRHQAGTILKEGLEVDALLREIGKPDFHAGILVHPDLEALKEAFMKHFTLVQAAGGLVENERGEFLLIFRRGVWDLPKGKLDKGETLETCAVREIREETGLQHVELLDLIMVTYHTYNDSYHDGRATLKETHWYRMRSSSAEILVPQTVEDIHEIKWVAPGDLLPYMENSFPSVRDVLGRA